MEWLSVSFMVNHTLEQHYAGKLLGTQHEYDLLLTQTISWPNEKWLPRLVIISSPFLP